MKKNAIFSVMGIVSTCLCTNAMANEVFDLADAAQAIAREVDGKGVTGCLVNEGFNTQLVISDDSASSIGRDICVRKARSAVFYNGYQDVSREMLSKTNDSGLLQKINVAELSPTKGSVGVLCDGKMYGLGVMTNGLIANVDGTLDGEDVIATDIIKKMPGCEAVKMKS